MERAEKFMDLVRAVYESYDTYYDYILKSTILTPDEKDRAMEEYVKSVCSILRFENVNSTESIS